MPQIIQKRDIVWIAVCVLLMVTTAGWWQASRRWKARVDEAELIRQTTEGALLESKFDGYRYIGSAIDWPDLAEVTGSCRTEPCSRTNLMLVYVDEVGCQTCQENVEQLVRDIIGAVGRRSVAMVMAAKEVRSAVAWARTGKIECPVYLDQNGEFAVRNHITTTPLALLLDATGRVAIAERFVVGRPQFIVPFKRACERLLAVRRPS